MTTSETEMEGAGMILFSVVDMLFNDPLENVLELLDSDSEDSDLEEVMLSSKKRETRVKTQFYFETVIPQYSLDDFKRHFRMTRSTFEALLHEVLKYGLLPQIQKHGKKPVDPCKQLLIGIWLLSNQEVYRSVGDRFGITMSTTYHCFTRVCSTLSLMQKDFIKWPAGSRVLEVVNGFESMAGFQRVLGAIDGSHIAVKPPADHSTSYLNRKKFHSIVLQAVCNHEGRFTDIYVGWPGSVHDARVLRNSPLYNAVENRLFPADTHLLGDAAYPLERWLISPYRDNGHLTQLQREFNTKHSSTRQVIERAFALLKGRWRKLKFLDLNSIKRAPIIVASACVLHNFCLEHKDLEDNYCEDLDDGLSLDVESSSTSNSNCRAAVAKRNTLAGII